MRGATRLPFDLGMAHYDPPPPDVLDDLESLKARDGFRFANELRAWIEVDGDRIIAHGHAGRGHIGSTSIRLGQHDLVFPAVQYPDLRPDPEVRPDAVRFVQTAGGRTGAPAPRRVAAFPYVRLAAPVAWTTLALTIRADGSSERELVGASPFPRHWIYDEGGRLVGKSGLIDFEAWYRHAFDRNTPWGGHDEPPLVAKAVSEAERALSAAIVGTRPRWRTLAPGETLVRQGEPGADVFLVMDGMLVVEIDGRPVAEVGPGAIIGERAALEGGIRTATLRATTPCRVAAVPAARLDPAALSAVGREHQLPEDALE